MGRRTIGAGKGGCVFRVCLQARHLGSTPGRAGIGPLLVGHDDENVGALEA